MDIKAIPNSLLTEQQAADMLGVKATTLQVWRCTKRYPLAYVRVGRCVRYQTSALERFVAERTVDVEA